MGFSEDIKELGKKISQFETKALTEEATKMSMILPFFQLLGYDVFNPSEFCPEFTADVGIKKGEKVDYAILINEQPVILIEAKAVNRKLDKHSSQLFRYFVTTPAKFAILTNGITYKFYTDLEEPNKMDKEPFLEFDLPDVKDNQINQIEKFHKNHLNIDDILDTASILKYNTLFKKAITQQIINPSNDFVKIFLQPFYKGAKTQAVIEKFKPILKNSLQEYINETVNDKIKSALDNTNATTTTEEERITTDEEWETITCIKNILKDTIKSEDIYHKQTESYLAILYKNNVRKWICRINLYSTQKILILPDENKKEQRYPILDIHDINNYSNNIIATAKRYLETIKPIKQTELLHTKWGIYEMPEPYAINLKKGPRQDLKKIKDKEEIKL